MAFRADFLKRLPLLFLFLLAACSWNEPAVIETPPEAKRVIEPFLEQLAAGKKARLVNMFPVQLMMNSMSNLLKIIAN